MSLLEKTLGLIAPHDCIVCGQEGPLLCAWCWPEACPDLPARCYRCRALTRDFAVCSTCQRQSVLKSVWVRTDYDSYAEQLIKALKFSRVSAASPIIAKLMAESLPFLPRNTIIVHVPTAMSRRRQRGYDQAELLARTLSRTLWLKHLNLLMRRGKSRQLGASRKQRLEQLTSAYEVRKQDISDKNILLVDDIVTTGATLEAAARALKDAGAKRIDAVVFAQKL